MSHFKSFSLDRIYFENISYHLTGFDPVLENVDFDLPTDQTVLVQSTNPTHAVTFLQILSGKVKPTMGKVLFNEDIQFETEIESSNGDIVSLYDFVGVYNENHRPHPTQSVKQVFHFINSSNEVLEAILEHFDILKLMNKDFKTLSYENQKLVMLVASTLKFPQLLILEDPASGVTEKTFLAFLDWIQFCQRQGHLRHIYLTNHNPVAPRHVGASTLFIEDGLIYFEDIEKQKKAVHF